MFKEQFNVNIFLKKIRNVSQDSKDDLEYYNLKHPRNVLFFSIHKGASFNETRSKLFPTLSSNFSSLNIFTNY